MVINISRLHLPIFGWRSFPITILNKIPWRMCLWVSSYSLHMCIVLSNGLVLNRQQTIAWTTKASMGVRSHQAFNRATYFQAKAHTDFNVFSLIQNCETHHNYKPHLWCNAILVLWSFLLTRFNVNSSMDHIPSAWDALISTVAPLTFGTE